jgi:hypothetical protein
MHGRWLPALPCALLLVACTTASGCGPAQVDLPRTLEVADAASGYSQETKDGRTRLVPTAVFRLRKVAADTPLDRVSLSVTFFRQPSGEHFDDIYLQRVAIGPEGSEALTIRADTGYTGDPPQTGEDMLQHPDFVDLGVRVMARQSGGTWTEIYTGSIERRILRIPNP